MKNKKDPLNFNGRTRIEVIRDFDEQQGAKTMKDLATGHFISSIQNALERLDEIATHLDDHLGFAPEEVTFDAAEIAQTILNKLDEALTAAEKTDDLNQALHQADKDNPARG